MPGGFRDIPNEAVIAAEHGILLIKAGDENKAVRVIPARFIMRGIGGIAAGRVMHDNHAAQLEEGGADPEGIGGISGQDMRSLM